VIWLRSLVFFFLEELRSGFVVILFNVVWLVLIRYFLRKLKKVKKSNGQVLAINEVSHFS
jgi:hypothetical protein